MLTTQKLGVPFYLILLGLGCLASNLLSACAMAPGHGFMNTNTPDLAGAKPQNYEQTIRDYLRVALKDPYSMQDFSVSEPVLTSCAIGIYGPFHAWRVPTTYNAKNSYGAYVGLQRYYYWFHGERVVGITQNPSFCPEASIWR
jgi:hypothetical protein